MKFEFGPIVKNDFLWSWVSSEPRLLKKFANFGRTFIDVLVLVILNIFDVIIWDFNDLEPSCGWIYNCHDHELQLNLLNSTSWLNLLRSCCVWSNETSVHTSPWHKVLNGFGGYMSVLTVLLYCWHIWQVLRNSFNPFQQHVSFIVLPNLSSPGWSR